MANGWGSSYEDKQRFQIKVKTWKQNRYSLAEGWDMIM